MKSIQYHILQDTHNIIPTKSENVFIITKVFYTLGGYDAYVRDKLSRGYYLEVARVKKVSKGCYVSLPYDAGATYRVLLHTVNRKSKKADASAKKLAEEKVHALINQLLKEQVLELV